MKIKITSMAILLIISMELQASFQEGVWRYEEGRYEAAIEEFTTVIKESKSINIDAYLYIIRSYKQLRNPEMMLYYARNAIQIKQNHPLLFYFKGVAHFMLGEFENCIIEHDMALQYYPHAPYIHNYKGLAYLRLKETAKAEEAFKKAVEYMPRRNIYHDNLGTAYERQGKISKALESYYRAYKLDPSYATAKNNYKRLLAYFHRKGLSVPLSVETAIEDTVVEEESSASQ